MALTGDQITGILRPEIDDDPLGRGYATMTDREAADDLRTELRSATRTTLRGREMLSQIDPAEYAALPSNKPEQHATVMGIVGVADEIDVGPGSFARTALINIFGSGSQTIANLAALLPTTISRAEELGIAGVDHLDVARARRG